MEDNMKTLKYIKSFFSKMIFLLICLALLALDVQAASYYISTSGNDNNIGSFNSPWGSFSHAMNIIQPGDTLYLMDGTYNESLNITVSGTEGNPIIFKALNDGAATIDCDYSAIPIKIPGIKTSRKSDITIEGIVAKESSGNVVEIAYSDRITLKRVSAYDTDYNVKKDVFLLYYSDSVLLEDCVASGWGRDMYMIQSSNNTTIRRCFGMWKGWYDSENVGGDNWIIQLYGSSDCIVDNIVGFKHPSAEAVDHGGGVVWCNNWNVDASRNDYKGCVFIDFSAFAFWVASKNHLIEDNEIINCVSIDCSRGFFQRGDDNLLVNHVTLTGTTNESFALSEFPYDAKDGDYKIYGRVKNSVFKDGSVGFGISTTENVIGLDHDFNNLHDITTDYSGTSPGPNEKFEIPYFDTTTYGNGAYLIRPQNIREDGEGGVGIGAEVLYRYQDGVPTNIPLWPWSMEDRIFAETGISVTWEENGGLWKTLDGVYSGGSITSSLKTTTPIIIDGVLSENIWSQANYVTFSSPSRSDNQVKVYTLYDDNNLYFAYKVTDYQLEVLNQALWNEDGVEIYVDTQNNKTTSMDSNDYHFIININDLASGGNISTKTITNQNGYTMEIAIPWTTINTTPTPNMTMGLFLGNNDRDNGISSQFDWRNLSVYGKPDLWGDIVLSSQVVDSDAPATPIGLSIQQ